MSTVLTSEQAIQLATSLQAFADKDFGKLALAEIYKSGASPDEIQQAITSFNMLIEHVENSDSKYKLVLPNGTLWLNREYFEDVAIVDVHGRPTTGSKRHALTSQQLYRLQTEAKGLLLASQSEEDAELKAFFKQEYFKLKIRLAKLMVNEKVSFRYDTEQAKQKTTVAKSVSPF
jgi:hypothetical protein